MVIYHSVVVKKAKDLNRGGLFTLLLKKKISKDFQNAIFFEEKNLGGKIKWLAEKLNC